MSTARLSSADRRMRDAVLLQLEWDPDVDASGIGVAARKSVVTLTGVVDGCAGKLAAERAAKRVQGVKAVANDIQVRALLPRTDAEIATDTVRLLEMRGALPEGVQVVVHNGHITLTGVVPTPFDRAYARKALWRIAGIKRIVNRIRVASPLNDDAVALEHESD
jgi:osmotically-inducible protein OsmY